MRLFVAVGISDETRAAMRAARTAIEAAVTRAPVPPRLTWVQESTAHVTLRFIGEVDDDTAGETASALAEPLGLSPFEVEWTTLGVFPPGRAGLRSPRAIWMGASSGADALAHVAQVVNLRLTPVVGAGGDRPFRAHLTLARVKLPGKGVPWLEALEEARPAPTRSRIDRVTLYRSQLSSRGPTYTAICQTVF